MYVNIYLYTDGVGVACSAFSCSCGGAGGLRCCVYEYIKACSVWCGVGVVVYICIYVCACRLCGGGLLVCIWIDIYNGGSLVFCACVYL